LSAKAVVAAVQWRRTTYPELAISRLDREHNFIVRLNGELSLRVEQGSAYHGSIFTVSNERCGTDNAHKVEIETSPIII
jgi:hypothetical protein